MTKLKPDSGEEVIVPHVGRTSIKLHLIKLYNSHCTSIGYTPLNQRSLYRVLDDCKASQRKALNLCNLSCIDAMKVFKQ